MRQLESVTSEAFAPFGTVLEFPVKCREDFVIVDTGGAKCGGSVPYRTKKSGGLKIILSPKSPFEPLEGITVLLVVGHDIR